MEKICAMICVFILTGAMVFTLIDTIVTSVKNHKIEREIRKLDKELIEIMRERNELEKKENKG